MSRCVQPSLFFLSLPDLKKLVCVTLTLQEGDEEPRSKQIKTCRELVLLYSDVLACPALDSFTAITAVVAIQFFQRGTLQMFAQRHCLELSSPQCVFPGDLQRCLSFSLITRLTPSWNKAGLYLISGKDFLTERGRLSAVSLELSTSGRQMCISVEANTVRLPPATLGDFVLPPLVLRKFWSDPDFILHTEGAVWCHVLPSMKKGQIITISRQPPRDGRFKTYRDLQIHWNHLYGYRLPDLPEEELVYCSVYFKLVGERLFTYPLSCIRLQPVQRCPRVNLQGALDSFLSDIGGRLKSVCGFPAHLTSQSSYHTVGLNAASSAKVLNGEHINLTASLSIRPVLTQLPAPPPSQPVRPSFRSQPPAWSTPLTQQEGALDLLNYGRGFGEGLTQTQRCRADGDWLPSSSSSPPISSSCGSFSFPTPSLSSSSSSHLHCFPPASCLSSSISFPSSPPAFQTASPLTSSISSSSLPVFRTASSVTSSISSSSSHPGIQPASSLTFSSSLPLPLFQPNSSTTSSSSLPVFQPALSIASSTSSSSLHFFQPTPSVIASVSSSVLSPSPPLVNPSPKLVPIFKNKHPSRHINHALLGQKQKEQLSRGGEDKGRVTLHSLGKKTSAQASSFSSLSAVPLSNPPPPTVSHFSRLSKQLHSRTTPQPSACPKIYRISSCNSASKFRTGLILPPKPEINLKSKSKPKTIIRSNSFENNTRTEASLGMKENSAKTSSTASSQPLTSSDVSTNETSNSCQKRVVFNLNPKKSRAAIQDVDVEEMARSNQLSKLKSATLLMWLKERGVVVGAKHKKTELMLKVMSCLAEA